MVAWVRRHPDYSQSWRHSASEALVVCAAPVNTISKAVAHVRSLSMATTARKGPRCVIWDMSYEPKQTRNPLIG